MAKPIFAKTAQEITEGHFTLETGVEVNLDCLAQDCEYFDKNAARYENCKKGFNGSVVLHLWGFCKHYKPMSKSEE